MGQADWLKRVSAVAMTALTLSLSPCGPVLATTSHDPERVPGQRPILTSDEAGIWASMDKAERAAKTSAERENDTRLSDLVHDVTCKLATEYCPELRVYVLRRPFFNATAAPNGYIEVWTGLLLRADTEDQLAFVLGHEITHYAQNHSIESWHAMKARNNGAFILTMAVAVAGAASAASASSAQAATDTMRAAQAINDIIYLSTVAAYFGFSRKNESEADELGWQRATKAGYDPKAAAMIWRNLMAETQASDFKKVRESETKPSIFDSHPITTDRIQALDTLAATQTTATTTDPKAYRAKVRPFLEGWLRDDLRRRDYGQTLAVIEHLSLLQEDLGLLHFYRGEALRLRHHEGDRAKAISAYQTASTYPDAPTATWRALGDLKVQAEDKKGAIQAYTTYLQRAPEAQDHWIIEDTLKQLTGGAAS
jgi:beta-barrel assembly-enhancing protease